MSPKILNMILWIFMISGTVLAGSFQLYPGARLEKKLTDQAHEVALKHHIKTISTVYTSSDSYEKVYEFYLKTGKEAPMSGTTNRSPVKLPDGRFVKKAYFIFDGTDAINLSKSWVTIQRPMIGAMKVVGGKIQFEDIREETAIQTATK